MKKNCLVSSSDGLVKQSRLWEYLEGRASRRSRFYFIATVSCPTLAHFVLICKSAYSLCNLLFICSPILGCGMDGRTNDLLKAWNPRSEPNNRPTAFPREKSCQKQTRWNSFLFVGPAWFLCRRYQFWCPAILEWISADIDEWDGSHMMLSIYWRPDM